MKTWTVTYNRGVEWMQSQRDALHRFCPSVGELHVVNNGPNFDEIDAECHRLGLESLRGPCMDTDPSPGGPATCRSHGAALNVLWKTIGVKLPEPLFILDCDCLPIRATDPAVWLEDFDVSAMFRRGVGIKAQTRFPTPVFTMVRNNLPDRESISFMVHDYHPRGYLDTGGEFGLWLERHPEILVREVPWHKIEASELPGDLSKSPLVAQAFDPYGFEVAGGDWLHMGNGSDHWGDPPRKEARRELFRQTVQYYLKG